MMSEQGQPKPAKDNPDAPDEEEPDRDPDSDPDAKRDPNRPPTPGEGKPPLSEGPVSNQ